MRLLPVLLFCLGLGATACAIDASEVAQPSSGAVTPSSVTSDAAVAADPGPAEDDAAFCDAAEAAFEYNKSIQGQTFSGPAPPEMVEYAELVHEAALLAPPAVAGYYELLDKFSAEAASETPGVMEPEEIRAVFAGLPAAALIVRGRCGFDLFDLD